MTAQPANIEPLTPREEEVLYLLFHFELDPSEIAEKLSISKSTLAGHTLNIYSKLGVSSRFEAVCKYAGLEENYRLAFIYFISPHP